MSERTIPVYYRARKSTHIRPNSLGVGIIVGTAIIMALPWRQRERGQTRVLGVLRSQYPFMERDCWNRLIGSAVAVIGIHFYWCCLVVGMLLLSDGNGASLLLDLWRAGAHGNHDIR